MNGCRRPLADDQWWNFCGETDMGQTAPALCTECGGRFKLKEDTMTISDPRAELAGKAAIDNVRVTKGKAVYTIKDPKGHFYFSLIKSGFRIIGSLLLIILGFIADEPLLSYGAGMFFIAEILGIAEEMT